MGTIKISKESMEKFNHDKNVVGYENRMPCPINNGADMHADMLLEGLFDDGAYVKNGYEREGYWFETLGFVNKLPVFCGYQFGENRLTVRFVETSTTAVVNAADFEEILRQRLTDEQVWPDIIRSMEAGFPVWDAILYYQD